MEKFNRELNGYKKSEVNQFLSDTIVELEGILKKAKEQDRKIQEQGSVIQTQNQKLTEQNLLIQDFTKQLEHYKTIESTLQKAILNAEESSNNMRKMARQEADMILEDAKRNANHVVNDALIRAEKIELKTATAERNLRIFKNRLRAIVEQQQAVVEDIEVLELDE